MPVSYAAKARSPLSSPIRHAGDGLGLDDFTLRGALGTGGTSQVLLVQRRGAAGFYAMKVIPKAGLDTRQVDYVVSENQMLQALSHPFIVKLHASFQDTSNFYLILQHHGGGDLAQHMLDCGGELDELASRVILGGCVVALRYLHEQHSIIYRDLKPENVLIDHRDGLPVLADMGAAKVLSAADKAVGSGATSDPTTHTHIGTPFYMAPEQWSVGDGGYSFSVDWWACGVLLYEMLLGDVPWAEGGLLGQQTTLGAHTLKAEIPLTPFDLPPLPAHLGTDARDLIASLLQIDPKDRLGGGGDSGRAATTGGVKVAAHVFFEPLDWVALMRRAAPVNLFDAAKQASALSGEGHAKGQAAAAFSSFVAETERSPRSPCSPRSPRVGTGRAGHELSPGGHQPWFPRAEEERVLEVTADGKLWSISKRLASMLGLLEEGGAASGLLQMVLGRPARVLVLGPYEDAFAEAIHKATTAAVGASGLDTSIGVAGRSGASLLLHCRVCARRLPKADVSNLFASSATAQAGELVRFVASAVQLLESMPPPPRLVGFQSSAPTSGSMQAPPSPPGNDASSPPFALALPPSPCAPVTDSAAPTSARDAGATSAREEVRHMLNLTERSALLHQVQRERGVSCASVASRGALEYFDVANFRARTDANDLMHGFDDQLGAARALVDAPCKPRDVPDSHAESAAALADPAALANSFYGVFVSYCAICEELLQEQDAMVGHGYDKGQGMVSKSVGDAVAHTLCIFSRLKECVSQGSHRARVLPQSALATVPMCTLLTVACFPLCVWYRSVGRQRAFLCGALALPEASIPAFSTRAFADLVVSVHQQRAYEEALEVSAPGDLLQLLRPGLKKPPALEQIQQALEASFDVTAVRATISVQRCWELHTEHINTLRRLEILLSNEVIRSTEVLAAQRVTARRAVRLAVEAIAAGPTVVGDAGYLEHLDALPPAVVKSELLRTLRALREGADAPSRSSHEERAHSIGQYAAIPLEQVRLEKRIGEGASGTTYRGSYRGVAVAVKVAGVGAGGFRHWRREVEVFTRIRHENIVRYFGAVESPPTYCLILEYCERGDLRSLLDQVREPTSPQLSPHLHASPRISPHHPPSPTFSHLFSPHRSSSTSTMRRRASGTWRRASPAACSSSTPRACCIGT